jgi:hypothetical protein
MPERLFSTRRRILVVAAVCSAIVLGSFALASWSFYNGHRDNCESRNTELNVIRDILIRTQPTLTSIKHLSPAQQKRSRAFYAYSFTRIQQARC